MFKLNLGPFNKCVDYLSDGSATDYTFDRNVEVFYYPHQDGEIVKIKSNYTSNDIINIPVFQVGCCSDGQIDNPKFNIVKSSVIPKNIADLISYLELEIIAMIYKIIQVSDIPLCLDSLNNIHIPVKPLRFYNDNRDNGCYGWVELGIAVMVPEEVAVDAVP